MLIFLGHLFQHLFTGQQVSLHRVMIALSITGPLDAFRAREAGRVSLGVDDADLSVVAARIGLSQ